MAVEKKLENGVDIERHEVMQPLVKRQGNGGEDSMYMTLLSTGIVVWGSFEFGTCVGFSAPTQHGIRDELGLSLSEFAVFGSILTIGAIFGAITSGTISDSIGRKGAMWLSSLFCLVGWMAIFFAQDALSLYFGRLSSGYGIGILSYVVPVFIAEISPKNLRGGLTTLNQLMICAGGSLAFVVGTLVTWRSLVTIGVFPCIVLLLGLFFIPESPRWLAKVGKQKEFQVALEKLRGKHTDISLEASEIQDYLQTLGSLPKAGIRDLFDKKNIRSVTVGVGLMALQQLGGINGIGFYAGEIFVSAGFPSGNLGTLLMGCIQVPITVVGAILMDKSGRKPLVMISALGTFLGTFLAGLSFLLKERGLYTDQAPTLALVGILVYSGFFSIGMGAVPWVIMSEIFAFNIKGIGGSLVTLVNWFGSWLVSYTFNFLMSWISSGTFFLYSAASALTVLFVVRVVPETKGKTLEEIQASMNS